MKKSHRLEVKETSIFSEQKNKNTTSTEGKTNTTITISGEKTIPTFVGKKYPLPFEKNTDWR